SLPPAASLADLSSAPDSSAVVALTARLARRGPPRPVLLLSERDGRRRAMIAAGGLYRWAFRGGASGEAYRALMAGLADWLLEKGDGRGERFAPVTYEVPNGMPTVWRWTGAGAPRDVRVLLTAEGRQHVDTLRFDAGGRPAWGGRRPRGSYSRPSSASTRPRRSSPKCRARRTVTSAPRASAQWSRRWGPRLWGWIPARWQRAHATPTPCSWIPPGACI